VLATSLLGGYALYRGYIAPRRTMIVAPTVGEHGAGAVLHLGF